MLRKNFGTSRGEVIVKGTGKTPKVLTKASNRIKELHVYASTTRSYPNQGMQEETVYKDAMGYSRNRYDLHKHSFIRKGWDKADRVVMY